MNILNPRKRKSNVLAPTRSIPPKRKKVSTRLTAARTSVQDSPPKASVSATPAIELVAYTRDPTYYFADGDIIVQSGTTLFRVHIDKLIKLGGIFEALLSLPQPANKEDAEYVDGLPVCPLFDTMPSDVRFLMGYAYGKIVLKTEVPDGVHKFHWHATVALLHLSHRLDLVAVRNNAIDALKLLFSCGPGFTLTYPAIVGVKSNDRKLFLRLFPLQAINLFRQYNLHALMPMAYYHAAQLSITDIVRGVVCDNGSRVTISTDDVVVVLEGREQLKLSRRTVLFRCLNDLTPGLPISEECPNTARSRLTGDTCLDYLLKMVSDFNRTSFMSRTDALETLPLLSERIFSQRLCDSCFTEVDDQLTEGLLENWQMLPTYFGFEGWEAVMEAQRSEEERYK